MVAFGAHSDPQMASSIRRQMANRWAANCQLRSLHFLCDSFTVTKSDSIPNVHIRRTFSFCQLLLPLPFSSLCIDLFVKPIDRIFHVRYMAHAQRLQLRLLHASNAIGFFFFSPSAAFYKTRDSSGLKVNPLTKCIPSNRIESVPRRRTLSNLSSFACVPLTRGFMRSSMVVLF